MILVDTSIWVSHFRDGNSRLENLLYEGDVASHPFIIGELACGNLKNRKEILSLLKELTMAEVAEKEEILLFIEKYRLMGKGLGFVDINLLASAVLTGIPLWSLDNKLNHASTELKINYKI